MRRLTAIPARRVAVAGAACAFLLGAAPVRAWEVNALVLEAAARQRESEVGAGRISFQRIEVETELDGAGRRKKPERRRYVVHMDGRGLIGRELLAVDDREATDEERAKSRREDDKLRRASLEGGAASDAEELLSGRVPLLDLLPRLDFGLVGEEVLDGRPSFVVEFRPKSNLVAKTVRDRVLNNFAGRAWIDVAEQQVRRIDGRLMAPVKVLGGLLLDVREVHLVYESREAFPGIWEPCREEIGISATAGMFLGYRREIRFESSGYRSEKPAVPLRAAW